MADEQEDRSIRKMLLDLEMKKLKIADAEAKRNEAKDTFGMMQGQPQANLPADPGYTPSRAIGAATTGPTLDPNQTSQSVSLPNTQNPIPRAPFTIPGVHGPDTELRPQSREELQRSGMAAKLMELQFEKFAPGQVAPALGPNPPAGPVAPRATPQKSMEQQLLEAEQAGDTAKAAQIRRVMNARDVNLEGGAGSRLTKRQEVLDVRDALMSAVLEGSKPGALVRLHQRINALGLNWEDEYSVAKTAATRERLGVARSGQLLETVPRDPFTGTPTEDPAAARDRRLVVGDRILRGDEPDASVVVTGAELKALARHWGVTYAQAKQRAEAAGKRVVE